MLNLINLIKKIIELFKKPKPVPKPKKATHIIVFNDNKEIVMTVTIPAFQKVTMHAQAVDAKGNPAASFGDFVWDVSPTGGVSLFPSNNGKDCDVVNLTATTQTVTVTGDATSTPGQNPISSDPITVITLGALAVKINVTADNPVDA